MTVRLNDPADRLEFWVQHGGHRWLLLRLRDSETGQMRPDYTGVAASITFDDGEVWTFTEQALQLEGDPGPLPTLAYHQMPAVIADREKGPYGARFAITVDDKPTIDAIGEVVVQ